MEKLTYIADSKLRKKPLLLKEYLLDDLSSCSSNGFRSYPRQHCCTTTVRFLVEIDLKNRSKQLYNKKQLLKSRSKSPRSLPTMSVLQRASLKVFNAVKSLPFTGGIRSQSKPKKVGLLRSILQRSFWNKHKEEIQRCKTFLELITDDKAIHAAAMVSNSPMSTSDFTESADNLQCSSGNSEVNQGKNDDVKRVGVTTGTTTTTKTTTTNYSAETTKEWQNEPKEQFSPVSVMDFPGDHDDQDEVSSHSENRLAHIEGTKKKPMHKIRRFESLSKLEPVDLEIRMALSDSDQESVESTISEPCSFSIQEEDRETQVKAESLLHQMKLSAPSFSFKYKGLENLLLDFFLERLTQGNKLDHELLNLANGWVDGEPREMVKEWDVETYRHRYIMDMERSGIWSKVDVEGKQEVGLEVEDEIFTTLLNEIFYDIHVY